MNDSPNEPKQRRGNAGYRSKRNHEKTIQKPDEQFDDLVFRVISATSGFMLCLLIASGLITAKIFEFFSPY